MLTRASFEYPSRAYMLKGLKAPPRSVKHIHPDGRDLFDEEGLQIELFGAGASLLPESHLLQSSELDKGWHRPFAEHLNQLYFLAQADFALTFDAQALLKAKLFVAEAAMLNVQHHLCTGHDQ